MGLHAYQYDIGTIQCLFEDSQRHCYRSQGDNTSGRDCDDSGIAWNSGNSKGETTTSTKTLSSIPTGIAVAGVRQGLGRYQRETRRVARSQLTVFTLEKAAVKGLKGTLARKAVSLTTKTPYGRSFTAAIRNTNAVGAHESCRHIETCLKGCLSLLLPSNNVLHSLERTVYVD